MKILIFGGDGMLGHQLFRQWNRRHETYVTLRNELASYSSSGLFEPQRSIPNIDVRSIETVISCVERLRPDALVNAVGLVKQRPMATESQPSSEINTLFPQQLAIVGQSVGARVVHFSTDCVFSGRKGSYTEQDIPDPEDLYGRSKLLGELNSPNCITFRTSIVGRELSRKTGLLEWFLAQRSSVRGFTRAIYTGFTTIEMARIVERLITQYPQASGVWHVSSDRISKYDLLCLVKKYFKLDTEIVPSDSFVCDRSLLSDRFRTAFGYTPPTWDKMVEELALDNDFYQ